MSRDGHTDFHSQATQTTPDRTHDLPSCSKRKIGLVLANGALSTQISGEGEIRRKIIEADLIEGIVAMPTQLFYSVTIPVTLWFITRSKKQTGKTLFIDARTWATW